MKRIALVFAVTITSAADLSAQGRPEAVRLVAVAGVKGVAEAAKLSCEREIGRSILHESFLNSGPAIQRIESGEPFDVAILLSGVVDELVKRGRLAATGRAQFASSVIGVAVRAGVERPDIATPEALRETLLTAKAVTYVANGASRSGIESAFADLGIAKEMESRTLLASTLVDWGERIGDGRAELGLTLVSDILTANGVDLVGAFPAKYQSPVGFAIAASARPIDAQMTQQLMACLMGPTVDEIVKGKGMRRLR